MTFSSFRVRHQTALLLVAGAAVLTLASVGHSQVQSPIDPTINQSSDVQTTDAQNAAALNLMMNWVESTLGPQLGMDNPRQEWTAKSVVKDNLNIWHFHLSQVFQGIPVKDGHLSLHIDEGALGTEPNWHGDYMDGPQVDINPKISKQRAIHIVEKMVRDGVQKRGGSKPPNVGQDRPNQGLLVDSDRTKSSASLEIHPGAGPGRRKLTYHVSVSHSADIEMEAWVDQKGRIVEAYNNAQTTHCQDGLGFTFYQGKPSYFKVAFWPACNCYVLNDNCMRVGTYDMNETDSIVSQASSGTSAFGNYSLRPCGSGSRNTSNADAYWTTVQTVSFMYYVLGRNFVDGAGGPRVYQSVDGLGPLITIRNHTAFSACNGNNAAWSGINKWVSVGNGDCINFRSFATLDLIGHEWTHGLTQYTGGLDYVGESGALNESFSDIFGAMTERYWYGESGVFGTTWQIGEGLYTPATAGDALRYMYRPTLDGYSKDYYPSRLCTSSTCPDNGGVHANSGIMNNAFWLLATGQCHRVNGCMNGGIGASKATQIFWRAKRYYTIPTEGFYRIRRTTQQAAADLYGLGSLEYNKTVLAWNLVGAP